MSTLVIQSYSEGWQLGVRGRRTGEQLLDKKWPSETILFVLLRHKELLICLRWEQPVEIPRAKLKA